MLDRSNDIYIVLRRNVLSGARKLFPMTCNCNVCNAISPEKARPPDLVLASPGAVVDITQCSWTKVECGQRDA